MREASGDEVGGDIPGVLGKRHSAAALARKHDSKELSCSNTSPSVRARVSSVVKRAKDGLYYYQLQYEVARTNVD